MGAKKGVTKGISYVNSTPNVCTVVLYVIDFCWIMRTLVLFGNHMAVSMSSHEVRNLGPVLPQLGRSSESA